VSVVHTDDDRNAVALHALKCDLLRQTNLLLGSEFDRQHHDRFASDARIAPTFGTLHSIQQRLGIAQLSRCIVRSNDAAPRDVATRCVVVFAAGAVIADADAEAVSAGCNRRAAVAALQRLQRCVELRHRFVFLREGGRGSSRRANIAEQC